VTDRIHLWWWADTPEAEQAVREAQALVEAEVLAVTMERRESSVIRAETGTEPEHVGEPFVGGIAFGLAKA